MKQKLLFILVFSLGLFSTETVFAYNSATVTSSPPTFGPQTNVKLTFSAQSASCSNGKSLFYLLQWFPDPKQSASQFINDGSGNSFTYTFSSATAGTMHKYAATFYCSPSKLFGSTDGIKSQLNLLNQNEQWVAVFSGTTQTNLPDVISDKTKVVLGDTIAFTVRNVPAGWSGTYSVNNGQEIEFSSLNLSLPATTANGFKDNADNTVTFSLYNQDGSQVDLKNEGVITINVNPNNKNQTPGTAPPGSTPSSNNDKLINPLPTDNLLATFLNIAKGFLAGIAIWAVIFIIVGGFRMVVAAGNEEAITVAKKTITWAILGLVIALLSFSIVAIVQNLLNVNVKDLNPGTINPSSYIQSKNIKT